MRLYAPVIVHLIVNIGEGCVFWKGYRRCVCETPITLPTTHSRLRAKQMLNVSRLICNARLGSSLQVKLFAKNYTVAILNNAPRSRSMGVVNLA